jgi:phosphatidylinositol-bisphosphatase
VDLFLESGVQSEMEAIRECLDTGGVLEEVYKGSIDSVAEVLIRFLESLAEPVIPYAYYTRCIEASGSYVECKQLLTCLKTVNYNVFYYLMAFLREVLTRQHRNRLSPEKLGMCHFWIIFFMSLILTSFFNTAVVFSSVLIRPPPPAASESVVKKKAKAEFIYHFFTPQDMRLP